MAAKVAELADGGTADFKPLYEDKLPLFDKIQSIVTNIYGATEATAEKRILDQLAQFEEDGYGDAPICMAKTQYSFSIDPSKKGAPKGHVVPIREVRLSAGAEFVVVICGDIMTMPGLPRVPAANSISVNEQGEIEGLF